MVRICWQTGVLFIVISLASTVALTTAPLNSKAPSSTKKKAVIVGGGPVGLATALTLSNPPHSYDVTVLEKESVEQYDPTKTYVYNVNPRGQVWMKENFPSVLEKLQDRGSNKSLFTAVPADPKTPVPAAVELGIGGTSSYWIPRHSLVYLLEEEIEEQETARKVSEEQQQKQGRIELKKSRTFSDLVPLENGSLEVSAKDLPSGKTETYCGNLIVAADGFNSAVRACLANDTKTSWLQSRAKKFRVKKWVSPASGLRMKILQIRPGFSIPDSDGSMLKTKSGDVFSFRGLNSGFTNRLSLGFLPIKDPSMIRTANVITRPKHEIWKIDNGPEAKEWFTKTFPRYEWDNYVVNDEEWERFAEAKGTTFPNCQYSPGLQIASSDGQSGVALVGDSAHAFPPDIGQGINAGLCDVVAFDRALRGKDIITGKEGEKPQSISAALRNYEKIQGPEGQALIRIARFGSPYQYRQSLLKDRIGSLIMTCNTVFRLLLNKLSFGKIPASCIITLQNTDLTYRQVMRRADLTTAGLSAAALTLAWRVFGASVKKVVGLA